MGGDRKVKGEKEENERLGRLAGTFDGERQESEGGGRRRRGRQGLVGGIGSWWVRRRRAGSR